MTSNEIFETLDSKGFEVKFSADHATVFVSLTNRTVNMMEIEKALNWQINLAQMTRHGKSIAIVE